jgi:hypothetical protein
MEDIDSIVIIISMFYHNNTRIMLFNSLLRQFLHYSQQRTPEYQIEMQREGGSRRFLRLQRVQFIGFFLLIEKYS